MSVSASTSDAPGVWQSLTPTGFARQEVSYVQVNGKFYLAGGSNIQQVYDPATSAWSNVASLPVPFDHVQAVTLNGLIYYVGGLTGWPSPHINNVQIYNPATNSFSQGTAMTRGRGAGGTAVYNGKIYYAGGLNNGNAVNWFDVYDPVANTWTALANMPTNRDHFHAAVVGSRFYAIGGRNVQIDSTNRIVDMYDFNTNAWTTLNTQLPTARGGFGIAVIGTEILVIGGEGGGIAHSEVEAYDTVANTWRTLTPMPTPRHGTQAAVCNGGVYIAAGGTIQGGAGPSQVHDAFFLNSQTACTSSTATLATSPSSLNFGIVNVGNSTSQAITLTNQSATASLQISAWNISGSNNFSITTAPSLPTTLGPNGSVNVTIRFAPTVGGLISGSFSVTHDGANSPLVVSLSGTGTGAPSPTPSPTPTQPPGQSILSFSLINAATNQPIAGYNPITNGAVINIPNLPSQNVYFRANTSPATVGSVRFGIDATANYLTDNTSTYDLPVNFSSASGWVGSHTLTATPYSAANAGGSAGTPLTLNFQLTNNLPPTLTPTPTPSPTPIAPPAAPTNLNASAVSASQINLTWTDNATNETNFEIQRSTTGSGGPFNPLSTSAANSTSYSNSGLSAGTQYCYRVRASNSGGTSAFTNVACATTNSSAGQSVVSISLINAGTGQPIAGYNPIPNGAVISVSSLPTRSVLFRANTSPATVGSVRFGINTVTHYLTDNTATYDMPVNLNGGGWVGSHTLRATPYSAANAGGTVGTAYTLNFQLTN